MTCNGNEGAAIARLLAEDASYIVGWVYQWCDGSLGVLWNDDRELAKFIDPPVDLDILALAAKKDDPVLIQLLKSLPAISSFEHW